MTDLTLLFSQLRDKIDLLECVSKEAKYKTEAFAILDKIEEIVNAGNHVS